MNSNRLTPTHTKAKTRRVRYYVSRRLLTPNKTEPSPDPSGWRLPAAAFERLVTTSISTHLDERGDRFLRRPDPVTLFKLQSKKNKLLKSLDQDRGVLVRRLTHRIEVRPGTLQIELEAGALSDALGIPPSNLEAHDLKINVPFQLRRRGVEAKFVSGQFAPEPDQTLIRAIARAHRWLQEVRQGISIAAIGRRHGWTSSPVRQRIKLAMLSPRITEAVLAGRQPVHLTLQHLLKTALPYDWDEQWKVLGFADTEIGAPAP